jgi:hypothetical protein
MRRRLTVLLLTSFGVLGAFAPSAFGAANPDQAPCQAQFVSTAPRGSVGPQMSTNAQIDRPFGQIVVSPAAHSHPPDCD